MRILIVLCALLAACSAREPRTKMLPGKVIEVPVNTYVPIAPELLERCKWPQQAPLREVVEVARKRRICLEQYERQLGAIEKVQGKPEEKVDDGL